MSIPTSLAMLRQSSATLFVLTVVGSLAIAASVSAATLEGRVLAVGGEPLVGAMVTARRGEPFHDTTVFTDETGAYRVEGLRVDTAYKVRVRRIGWRGGWQAEVGPFASAGEIRNFDATLERETDAEAVAAQLPASRWFSLVLDDIDADVERELLVRQCTYCHQQGNKATRKFRDPEEWTKVLSLMARMGGMLTPALSERIPEIFNRVYAAENAVPLLTAGMNEPGFAPPPSATVRSASIEEWELGLRNSMQHDLLVHPSGGVYSVDMMQDKLYHLNPETGERSVFAVPRGDLPPGGVFGGPNDPSPPNANAHVGPHSLQVAPDGAVWVTLAMGNQLARFDPVAAAVSTDAAQSDAWQIHDLEEGYYPHTLRFDPRGRVWYTVAGSNHVGMLDPSSGEHRWIRLPTRNWGTALVMRMMPAFIWLSQRVDFDTATSLSSEGATAPVPYGIDVAPDGGIWFSQLNDHRIGRIDPDSFATELIDTPFSAPRRLRFDAAGMLWIPGFSSGVVASFDPQTREFREFPLPTMEGGRAVDAPYALNVDRERGGVWICGTNSDTLIRFDPDAVDAGAPGSGFTVYPLPTRVTYTREIDFDSQGRIWTSNSNLPSWQIEGGFPRVIRLDTGGPTPERTAAR